MIKKEPEAGIQNMIKKEPEISFQNKIKKEQREKTQASETDSILEVKEKTKKKNNLTDYFKPVPKETKPDQSLHVQSIFNKRKKDISTTTPQKKFKTLNQNDPQ